MDKNLQKRMRYCISLFIASMLLCISGYAQTIGISGKVTTSDKSEPIPGVTIKIKGTAIAVASATDGTYKIMAKPGDILVFSFLGYERKEIAVKNSNTINVKLDLTSSDLNEVVVVGYGKMRKKDLTGSISSIKGDYLRETQPTTFDQALQGKVAGVVVQQISGQPGGGVSIQIRGVSSISGSNSPLVVIDGVIIPPSTDPGHGSNPLSGINPNDIETLDVLKDASATAIYGSQATNGVIVITTKRGKAGRPTISYDFYTGEQEIINRLPVVNLQQYATFLNARAQVWGFGARPELANPQYLGTGTDWQSALFRRAPINNHSLTISGGDDKTTYYLSGTYFDQQGIALGSDFKRYSVRLNLDTKTTKWLKLGTSLQFFHIYENTVTTDGNVISTALSETPDVAVKNADGSYGGSVTQNQNWIQPVANPVGLASLLTNESARYQAYTNAYAEIQFTKDLSFRTEVSGNFTFGTHDTFNPVYVFGNASSNVSNPVNSAESDMNQDAATTWRQYLTFNHSFRKFTLNILGGHEANTDYYENVGAGRQNFPSNEVQAINDGDATVVTNSGDHGPGAASESYFGRFNFSWDDKYLLTGNLRDDGSSSFPINHNWAVTYSGAFAWKINNEAFLKDVKEISELKLRLGYGLTNNQGIPGNTYVTQLSSVPTGLTGVAQFQSNLANDVTWEKTNYYNAGLDGTFFNGRISFSADVYDRETNDLLLKMPLPEFSGTNTGWSPGAMVAPYANVGSVRNRGFDLQISATNVRSTNFTWKTDFTLSRNINKVLSLGSGGSDASLTTTYQKTAVGQPIGEFYGYVYQGIFAKPSDFQNYARTADQNGNPYPISPAYGGIWYGDRRFKDLNGDGIIDTRDQTFLGSPLPEFQYGINNSFTYKNFDLDIFFSGSYGNKVYNQLAVSQTNSQNNTSYFTAVLNYAKYALINPNGSSSDVNNVYISNPNTSIPGLRNDNTTNDNNRNSSLWVQDASYLRCKNITLGYRFPERILSKISVQSLRVYANVSNAFVITKYKGMDPEIGSWDPLSAGVDGGNYPQPRVFTIGANLTFNK
jgi:TonB-linked SusC/RagA family outer membrane protein